MAKKSLVLVCAFILFFSMKIWGKDKETSIPLYELDPVVVTAQRSESLKSNVPQTIEIITQDDIKKSTANNVADILVKKTNMDIIKYPGVSSVVNLRGFAPELMTNIKHHSFLIDGRKAGIINLASISLQNVERIEVLKGPASSLYGSDAMAGVINIITKKSKGKIKTNINLQGNKFNSQAELTTGGSIEKFNFDFSFNNIAQNNYNVPKFEIENFKWDGGIWKENKFSTFNYTIRLGYNLNKNHNLNLSYGIFTGKNIKTAGSISKNEPTKKDLDYNSIELSYNGKTEKNNWLIKFFTVKDNKVDFNKLTTNEWDKSFLAFTDYNGIQSQNTIFMTNNELTFGIDYNQDKTISERYAKNKRLSPYNPNNEKQNLALFAENKLSLMEKKLITTLGGRYDLYRLKTLETPYLTNEDKIEKEKSFNPRGGIVYHLTNAIRFHSSIGTAFIIPNPMQKAGYYISESTYKKTQTIKTVNGNPKIKPENSLSYDFGCEFNNSLLNIDMIYLKTNVKDKIVTKKISEATTIEKGITITKTIETFENIDKSEIIGIENIFSFNLGKIFNLVQQIKIYSNYTYLFEAKNINVTKNISEDISNISKTKSNYGIEYNDEKLNGNLYFRYLGTKIDSVTKTKYGNQTIADISLIYKIIKNVNINVKVENIFDKMYQEKLGYPMPGRNISAGLNLNF